MTMAPLHTLGVAEGVALVRQGEVSPVAIAEDCLKRIEALEPVLQAWVTIDREGALAAARRCEQQIQRGENPGLLAGVQVGLKDIFYTAGLLTTAGASSRP
jgi:aspartyl-tRNA(Asn)/glutamyl-tRNA(Gln) amidotransferase subunit A